MRKLGWLIFAAVIFAFAPLSLSSPPSSSSWSPQVTVTKAEAYVTYRRARVTTRRAYRRGYRASYYNAHQDGVGGYPYSSGYYAYRGVYAPPVVVHRGWGRHRPHWGPVRGWHWWR